MTNREANDVVAELIREKIRSIVDDPETAEALCPTDHPFGTKRPCLDTGYYETFNLPARALVDLRKQPITTVTETGIETSDETFEFDVIVYATGFDAMTGAIVGVDITGKDGVTLKEKWDHGPITYLGLMTVGFPNLFMITGPGSPSVLSNMAVSIEQHVDWIADQLGYLRDHGYERIEPTETAEAGWVQHVNDCADITLYPTANSWYMGANVPGKPRVFLPYIGGVDVYRATCDEVVERDFLGFELAGPGGTQCNDGVVNRLQPDVKLVLDMMAGLDLPPLESMTAEEARAFMTEANAVRPPGPDVGEIVDGVLPGAGGDLDYRLYRPASPGPHPRGRLLPRRRLGARQPRDRRPVLPRPVRAQRHGHRLGRLPPRARGPLPGGRRRRLRRAAVDRRPHPGARRRARPADRGRLERRRQPRRRRQPAGARCRRPGDRRAAADHAGDRLRPDTGLLRRERRRLRPHQAAHGVVLGPLRRRRPIAPTRACSPLRAADLSGLPPAFIVTGEFDPLRDEGNAYAAALEQAGVPVTLLQARGHTHTSLSMVDVILSGAAIRAQMADALKSFVKAPVPG